LGGGADGGWSSWDEWLADLEKKVRHCLLIRISGVTLVSRSSNVDGLGVHSILGVETSSSSRISATVNPSKSILLPLRSAQLSLSMVRRRGSSDGMPFARLQKRLAPLKLNAGRPARHPVRDHFRYSITKVGTPQS
jgi:hypothetical protein